MSFSVVKFTHTQTQKVKNEMSSESKVIKQKHKVTVIQRYTFLNHYMTLMELMNLFFRTILRTFAPSQYKLGAVPFS